MSCCIIVLNSGSVLVKATDNLLWHPKASIDCFNESNRAKNRPVSLRPDRIVTTIAIGSLM